MESEYQTLEEALLYFLPGTGVGIPARYAIEGPAKRLRPRIVIALAKAYGKTLQDALAPACAIEYIHTYSLIHDDLPCMDNDDMRRGKASLHKAFNEGEALLTGDFFLTLAFEILANAAHLSPSQALQLTRSLAHAAGECGMIGGQNLDLMHQGHLLSPELREEIALKKTASLFTAAFEFGGIVAGTSDLPLLKKLGTHFGLAFQLIDDIIDDEITGGITLVDTHLSRFSEALQKLSCDPAPILALADEMAIPLKQIG